MTTKFFELQELEQYINALPRGAWVAAFAGGVNDARYTAQWDEDFHEVPFYELYKAPSCSGADQPVELEVNEQGEPQEWALFALAHDLGALCSPWIKEELDCEELDSLEHMTEFMDPDLLEQVRAALPAGCSREQFLQAYRAAHLEKFGEQWLAAHE